MAEILFARVDDVDASAAVAASVAAAASQAAAANSANDAQTAQAGAETAQTAAEVAQAAAEAAVVDAETAADNFDDIYLGSHATDPLLDNDGDPLVEGQLYWNSVTNTLNVYDGAAWNSYSATSGITDVVQDTTPQLGGDLDPNGHAITGYSTTAQADVAYQPKDTELTALASVTSAANKIAYFTGAGTATVTDFTAYGRSIVGVADEAAFKALVNLEADTDYQAYDAELAALAGLTSAADKVPYFTGAGAAGTTDFTSVARTLVGQSTQALMRTTGLGLGTSAVVDTGTSGTKVPLLDGVNTWSGAQKFLNSSGIKILDTNASHSLGIIVGTDLSADHTLTFTPGNADRVITISGNTTISQDYSTTGNPQFATIELGHASANTLSASSGVLSIESVAVKNVGKETIWVPANAMISRTTNGAASGSTEMATNKNMFKTFDFDTTTQEFVQFSVWFPKSWNLGTVTFQPVWSHAATVTNFGVVWGLAGVARSDDDAGDVAFGTAQTSTDTGGTTNDIYLGPESAAITIAGTPATGDNVQFQINRTVANGSDTLGIDAQLHGIRLFFTSNAATDA